MSNISSPIQFSIIVPVYNRPQEMAEFLESLALQTDVDFELMVMEGIGGSSCKTLCQQYGTTLNIQFHENNEGRSQRRNLGMQLATGNYFLLFDSDCILPKEYIATLRKSLQTHYVDCYGGPDSADSSFSNLQLAVNYSMTSFMTTGGIRGGMKQVDKYLPRAFNMGFSREVFEKTGGYYDIIGEDVDLSMRIKEAGFSVRLIKEAVVYHKRRLNIPKFYKQVNTFGKARILLSKLHPNSAKLIHYFPALFTLGNIALVLGALLLCPYFIIPIGIYILALFTESLMINKKMSVAILSIVTSYVQLFGYGLGFINESITKKASKRSAETMYRQ